MKTYNFPKPPSLNKLINTARSNRYAANTEKQKWTKKAKQCCEEQGVVPFSTKVWLSVEITYSTTASDFDNLIACLKPILDGMVKAGVLEDDSLKYIESSVYFKFTKTKRNNQYVNITVHLSKHSFNEAIKRSLKGE